MKLRFSVSILLVLVFFISFSCKNTTQDSNSNVYEINDKTLAKQFDWLIGTWIIKSDESVMYEIWEVQNDSLLTAHSFALENGDTIFTEFLKIYLVDGDCFLSSAVSDQNDGDAISFKLVEKEELKLVFENLEHDFPQRIVYESKSENNLFAYIEGEVDGKSQRIDFDFAKIE